MDKIRDLKHKGKYVTDDRFIDEYAKHCGVYATGVYASLCRHANKEQTCFPSKARIALQLNISERKVYDGIKILEKLNIIKIQGQGRRGNGFYQSKLYILLDISQWEPVPTAPTTVGIKKNNPSAGDVSDDEQGVPNKETHKEGNTNKETGEFVDQTESFNIFWGAYPKKEGRREAEKIWSKMKLAIYLPDILAFIEKAERTSRWRIGYIKNPAYFLKNENWKDDLSGYTELSVNKKDNVYLPHKNKYEKYK